MDIIKGIPPEAKNGQLVAMDVETFGQEDGKVHRPTGTFACLSIAIEGDENVYQVYDEHDIKMVLDSAKTGEWVFHNSVYDLTQLRRFAKIKPRYIFDTELVERCGYGGYYDFFSLKDLARRWLDVQMEKEVREDFSTMTEMTPEMIEYAAHDAELTLKIALLQKEHFAETNALSAYNRIDEPAIWPTLDMQPMKVDVVQWEKNVTEYTRIAKETENEIGVNSMSPKQVKLKAKDYGLYLQDTKAATLKEYQDNPFVAGVLKARMYRKAVSTYGMSWLEKYVEEGDLVYASYRVTGAETGRRSSSNPNMQQIPSRKMPEYRDLFVTKSYRMMVGDASMQELCILAAISQDKLLINSIKNGEDLHQATADSLGIDRDAGKTINYAIPYGTTAVGLSKNLGVSEQKAENMLSLYFAKYTGVMGYVNSYKTRARQFGYVETVAGRPVFINPYDLQWENNAINAPIQGGAADFSKRWERLLWEGCQAEGIPYSVCGVIHDEIVTDPPKDSYKTTQKVTKDAFYQAAKELFPSVPMKLDLHSGKRWSCKKEEDEYDDEEI